MTSELRRFNPDADTMMSADSSGLLLQSNLSELAKNLDAIEQEITEAVFVVPVSALYGEFRAEVAKNAIRRHAERTQDLEGQLDQMRAEVHTVQQQTKEALNAAAAAQQSLKACEEDCARVREEKEAIVDQIQAILRDIKKEEDNIQALREENRVGIARR